MRKVLLVFLGVFSLWAVTVWIRLLPPETVLPNGFVIRGNDVVLWPGGKEIANDDVDFICFDDRYLWILTIRGGSLLLDAQTLRRVDQGDGYRLIDPSGLRTSGVACNGYYTSMNGPGLLHDGARFPFLPDCRYVNHANPALRDKAWLNRPCADR